MLTAATRQLDRLAAPEEALATLLTAPDRAWRDPRLPALAHRAIKAGADGLAFLEALAPPALARVDPHSDLARDLARATARRDLARAAVDAERQQLAQKTGAARLHLPRALVAVHPPLGAADRSTQRRRDKRSFRRREFGVGVRSVGPERGWQTCAYGA